ncbi:MAG: acyltransferase family protein [Sulfuricaulis sp.]
MKLSHFTQGRNNNFNLIRIVAAFAVMITHSFALAIGTGEAEPFRESLGMTIGSIAVDVFFIASGFLVTASLLTRQSAIEFIWARTLRIFPALLVMLLLTVFGLGVFFTTRPLFSYLTDSSTYIYLAKCATLITGVVYKLPGVFESNPYRYAINGSLWTMPYEIRMYTILAVVWIALRFANRVRLMTFRLIVVTCPIIAGVIVVARHFYFPAENYFAWLFFMFFTGAAFYVLKEQVTLSRSLFWLFVIALLASAVVNKSFFFIVYVFTIAYILLYIAYIPSGLIRKYNQVGDYSYGVYIYAFPIQQSVAALVPGVSVLSMLLISAAVTLLLAALSWHLLERHALGLKQHYVNHTKRILNHGLTNTPPQVRQERK